GAVQSNHDAGQGQAREFAWSAAGGAPATSLLPVFDETTGLAAGGATATTVTTRTVARDGTLGPAVRTDVTAKTTQVINRTQLGITQDTVALLVTATDATAAAGGPGLAELVASQDGSQLSVIVPTDAAVHAQTFKVRPLGP
ncbi:MAG: hypothetical protein LBM66_06125, partial [Bifidobacteriaceae bacterium]|nr:hypothetical protein [Bifidobacteriaceae bacterium]